MDTVLHPHARTATGRVLLTPSRHLALSPCPLRLHGPCRGREGALHACSHLRSLVLLGVWRVDTRVRRHQMSLSVGGGCTLLHTHHAAQLPHPLSLLCMPLSHHPTAASISTLQLHCNLHPVQAVGATVPPSAAHTG